MKKDVEYYQGIEKMRSPRLFAPSVLDLGEAETPIAADKRLCFAQIALDNFFYPQNNDINDFDSQ